MAEQGLTIANVRLSYTGDKREEEKEDLWVYYVVRGISFYPTWLFLKLGISANQTSYISILVALAGCSFLSLGAYSFRVFGALLINFWIVLDCVDGNIARYKRTISEYGQFMDALCGYFLNAILFLSAGIGAYTQPEPLLGFIGTIFAINMNGDIFIVLGAWASISIILSRLIFHKFINVSSNIESSNNKFGTESLKSSKSFLYLITHNIVSFSGFLLPGLLFAVIFRLLSLFVLFYALMNTMVLIVTTYQIIVKSEEVK